MGIVIARTPEEHRLIHDAVVMVRVNLWTQAEVLKSKKQPIPSRMKTELDRLDEAYRRVCSIPTPRYPFEVDAPVFYTALESAEKRSDDYRRYAEELSTIATGMRQAQKDFDEDDI
jgi:hypothetical protein